MIGEKQIIECRTKGMRPTAIFFEIGRAPIKSKFLFDDPEMALAYGMYPTVFIEKLDPKVDVRFTAGCRVHIYAPEIDEQVVDFAERIAKLNEVVTVCSQSELLNYENGEWHASSYE